MNDDSKENKCNSCGMGVQPYEDEDMFEIHLEGVGENGAIRISDHGMTI